MPSWRGQGKLLFPRGQVFLVHAIKLYGRQAAYIHSFITSDGLTGQLNAPANLPAGKTFRQSLNEGLGGPQLRF